MEHFLFHIYAFAEIYSVLLCWLVVPLVYASAYFYFIRNLPALHVSTSENISAPAVIAEAPVPPVEAPPETLADTMAEVVQQVQEAAAAETEAAPEAEAKVANG
mgnify:CR=1 FL=1